MGSAIVQLRYYTFRGTSSMFERIYESALYGTKEELQESLAEGFIDTKDSIFPFPTVAEKLAFEGQHVAVEHLRKRGANVSCIACGYARASSEI